MTGRLASSGDRAGAATQSSPVPGLEQSRSSHGADERTMLADLWFEECPDCCGTGCAECDGEGTIPVWDYEP